METNKKKSQFIKRHPIIFNLILIAVATVILCSAALFYLDIFTEHGKTSTVPNVKNMQLADAITTLRNAGFNWEVTDSLYNDTYDLGAVVEQTPKENSSVKSHRTIYLSVNSSSPRTIALPNLRDLSIRQGESTLKGLGFHNISIDSIPSPFKGLIIRISVDGREVEPGTKILPSAHIRLSVGNGYATAVTDTIPADDSFDPYADNDSADIFL